MKAQFSPVLCAFVMFSALLSACSSKSVNNSPDNNPGAGGGSSGAGGNAMAGATSGDGGNGVAGTATGGGTTAGASTGGSAGSAGSTAGSNAGGAAALVPGCSEACMTIIAANCPAVTETQAQCEGSCSSSSAECRSELSAYASCIANDATIMCVADGFEVDAACDDAGTELQVCSVCEPQAGETACGTCTRGSCCTQLRSYVGAEDALSFFECFNPCATQECFDACATMYPGPAAAYESIFSCQETSCTQDCVCAPDSADDACTACAKANCCASLVAYSVHPDATPFDACLGACEEGDDACVDVCVGDFPDAANALVDLLDCVDGGCATECGG